MSREDEGRLADRLIAGDPSAFRDLMEAYKRKVYGLAYEMTQNHADAEDVSQVAFMKVHRSIGTLKPGRGLNAWLYQIVYRTAIDHIRKRSFYPKDALPSPPRAAFFSEPPDPTAGPEKSAEVACLRKRIDEALAKVSSRERAAIILRHYHDLKLREIAQTLGVSLGSAKSYLFRALRKLQKELDGAEICLNDGDRP
jgi:RNA polymerase sigma-70 factor (ECF subfamily)